MIATCTRCGTLYEAGSEEQANEQERLCFGCRYGYCQDCGLHKERETKHLLRCSPCQSAWNEKMRELGSGE